MRLCRKKSKGQPSTGRCNAVVLRCVEGSARLCSTKNGESKKKEKNREIHKISGFPRFLLIKLTKEVFSFFPSCGQCPESCSQIDAGYAASPRDSPRRALRDWTPAVLRNRVTRKRLERKRERRRRRERAEAIFRSSAWSGWLFAGETAGCNRTAIIQIQGQKAVHRAETGVSSLVLSITFYCLYLPSNGETPRTVR